MILSLILSSVMGVVPAQAKDVAHCKKDFAFLQNKEEVSLVRQESLTVGVETDLSKKRRIVQEAVTSYLKVTGETEIPEWGLEIEVKQYVQKSNQESLGYKVVVNGGDEAIVDLYYKLHITINEPVESKLLYFVWHNQSPVREWACELY